MTPIRNNVIRLPELTDAQVADRFAKSHAAQAEFFRRFGLAVVPTRTPVAGLPRLAQMAVEAWCRVRFCNANPMQHGGE